MKKIIQKIKCLFGYHNFENPFGDPFIVETPLYSHKVYQAQCQCGAISKSCFLIKDSCCDSEMFEESELKYSKKYRRFKNESINRV